MPGLQTNGAFERRYHCEIELIVEHHVGQHAAIALDDMQANVRATRHEVVEHWRQQRAREGRHQPDAQFAGDLAGQGERLLGGLIECADGGDAMLVIAKAGRRRRHRAGRTLEQLDLERALDRRDVLRNAGLGGVLARGGAGERAFLADRDDGADLP